MPRTDRRTLPAMGAGASSSGTLPEVKNDAVERAFSVADDDKDGRLSFSELAGLLKKHGHAEPEKRAKGLVMAFGTEEAGMSLSEFVGAVAELNAFVHQLQKPAEETAPAASPTVAEPAAAAPAASALEAGLFDEMNLARRSPVEYAAFLEPMLALFKDKVYTPPGAATAIVTQEGASAVSEAIDFLKKQAPIEPFASVSAGMSKAARDHVEDTGPKGLLGHSGSDGSSPFDRLNRHGQWKKTAGENINYGAQQARDAIIQLMCANQPPPP